MNKELKIRLESLEADRLCLHGKARALIDKSEECIELTNELMLIRKNEELNLNLVYYGNCRSNVFNV